MVYDVSLDPNGDFALKRLHNFGKQKSRGISLGRILEDKSIPQNVIDDVYTHVGYIALGGRFLSESYRQLGKIENDFRLIPGQLQGLVDVAIRKYPRPNMSHRIMESLEEDARRTSVPMEYP